MDDRILRFYHGLPTPLRSVAASMHGYYLRWCRYGKQTEEMVAEALERDTWCATRWKEWQQERIARLLHHTATTVPYYRQFWSRLRSQGDQSSWEILDHWPIIKKEQLRRNPRAFLSDIYDVRSLFQEQTSGTTGTPLTVWATSDALRSWYVLAEARWRCWYGISRKHRWAMIGGQRIVPFYQERPPFWVWNAGLNQLYLSSLHIKPQFLSYYIDALRRYSVDYLYGYSSALYCLAQHACDTSTKLQLKVVLSDAEPLYDHQREAMERAFSCPVHETYGQSEKVCGMSECQNGKLHAWPEVGHLELLDDHDQHVQPGEAGSLVCTGFLNDAMPLIRYEIGDMARSSASDAPCLCGRTLPVIGEVLGRCDDVIVTQDGRRLALLDIIFDPDLHLREAQIVQESLNRFRVNVVPTAGWGSKDEQRVCTGLRQRVGDVEVIVQLVAGIERTWAGKFRMLVSEVDPHLTNRTLVSTGSVHQ